MIVNENAQKNYFSDISSCVLGVKGLKWCKNMLMNGTAITRVDQSVRRGFSLDLFRCAVSPQAA